MSNDNVIKMVDSLADGDNIAAQDAFKSALSDKIGQALDDKRVGVAKDWLNAGDELEGIQDASGLDDVGVVSEPGLQAEPIEIDSEEDENEQPAVSEV
tara:strand:+ start:730 stop:1023 length:294 start_codon:yes stop_codon:yes gene_type:complete